MRAVIDWSWELLAEPERALLRRLAVHVDGCTLAAAEEVCSGEDVVRGAVVGLLARLVECSLVVMTETPGGPRYRLLESVLAYCLGRLDEAGESELLRRRHLDYYIGLAERADPQLRGRAQREWLRRFDAETPNMRAAFDTALRLADAERALRLANALTWYWHLRGRRREARRSLTAALALPGTASAVARARATAWRTGITLQSGAMAGGVTEHLAALDPYETVDDLAGRARAEWFLGTSLYGAGDAETLVERALTSFHALADRWGIAAALCSRAFQAKQRGDLAGLHRDGERSLELFTEVGDEWGQLQASVPLTTLAEIDGRYELAAGLYGNGLRIAEELQLWPDVSFQLSGLGRIAMLRGEFDRAREFHEKARQVSVEQSDTFGEQYAVVGLALGARREGKLDTAQEHIRQALGLHRQMGYDAGPSLLLDESGFIAELQSDAETAWQLHLDALAAARTTDDPRAIALALEGLAGALSLGGDPNYAARLLGAADVARTSIGAPLPSAERGDVDRISSRLRAALGGEEFAAELSRGAEVELGELVSASTPPTRIRRN